MQSIIHREQEIINRFFQTNRIHVPALPNWIDNKIIKHWQKLIFNLHYLPKISLEQNLNLPLWQDKPNKYFYQKIAQNKLDKRAKELPGKWILIDARDKPPKQRFWLRSKELWLLEKLGFTLKNYLKKSKKQLHQQEYLGSILEQNGFGSRFCLSIYDIEKLKPDILKILEIKNKKVRLPYFIEYNYLGNAFYKQLAKTQTWEWFEDKFEQKQNLAGGSGSIGCFGWEPPDFWSTILSFRPVIEL